MDKLKVHFIHVGNMNNKGTQALFASDVSIIKEVDRDADVSVSTTDIDGVNKMKLPLNRVLSPRVDFCPMTELTNRKNVGLTATASFTNFKQLA
jgi:hypothetical protein